MTSEKCSLLSSYLFLLKKYPAFQLSHKLFDHCLLCYWNHPILKDWNASEKKAETLPLIFLPFSNKSPQGKNGLKRNLNRGFPLPLKRLLQGSEGERGGHGAEGTYTSFSGAITQKAARPQRRKGMAVGCTQAKGTRDSFTKDTPPKLSMGIAENHYS